MLEQLQDVLSVAKGAGGAVGTLLCSRFCKPDNGEDLALLFQKVTEGRGQTVGLSTHSVLQST